METKRYVYMMKHISTGKIYIGQSTNPQSRLLMHIRNLLLGRHSNKQMQSDFDGFGGEYEHQILEDLGQMNMKDASLQEWMWIVATKSYLPEIGYNGCDPCVRNTRTHEYTKRMQDYFNGSLDEAIKCQIASKEE